MGGKYTEAQKKATAKYQKENTEMVSFRVPKGKKQNIKPQQVKQERASAL